MQKKLIIPKRQIVVFFGLIFILCGSIYIWNMLPTRGFNAPSAILSLVIWIFISGVCMYYLHKEEDANIQYILGMILVITGICFVPIWELLSASPHHPTDDQKIRLLYIENFSMTLAAVVGGSILADAIYCGVIAKTSRGAALPTIAVTNTVGFMLIVLVARAFGTPNNEVAHSIAYWSLGIGILSLVVVWRTRACLTKDHTFLAGLVWILAGLTPSFFWQIEHDISHCSDPNAFFSLWRNFNLFYWGGLGAGTIANSFRINENNHEGS